MNAVRILLCILLTVLVRSINGQSCTCNVYEINKAEINDAIGAGDSVSLRSFRNQIGRPNSDVCRFYSDFLQIKFDVKSHDFTLWDSGFEKLQQDAKTLKCDNLASELLNLQAEYYLASDQLEEATRIAYQLLKQAESSQDADNIVKSIMVLVSVFSRQDQNEAVYLYIKKIEQYVNRISDPHFKSHTLVWLGLNYETLFTIYGRQSSLDSASLFTDAAYSIARKNNYNKQLQMIFHAKEAIAYHRGDLALSLALHDSIYQYIVANGDKQQLPVYFQMKAETLLEAGRTTDAAIHQDSAIYYARAYAQPSYLANFLKSGADNYEALGLLPASLACLKEYMMLRDSLQTDKRTEIINELEQKYEKEKNEKTILELNSQRKFWLISIILVLLLAGLFYMIYRQKLLKQGQIILEIEQRLNRARMNPHFFFNALASLQSFALNETNAMAVAENLSKFSHIMRETLENTYREYNTVQQEIDFLREYLELQQMRFPDKFTFAVRNSLADPENVLVPSMIVQPFVENSIEHGFSDLPYVGHIDIIFSSIEKNILIKISDNGKGFNQQPGKAKPYISRASQIIKDRIYLLNLKLKSNATFEVLNGQNDSKGVQVNITFPEIYEDQHISN